MMGLVAKTAASVPATARKAATVSIVIGIILCFSKRKRTERDRKNRCPYCFKRKKLIKSHIVSNFLRRRLTGISTPKGMSYRFKWQETGGSKADPRRASGWTVRPNAAVRSQDLPKPRLFCRTCDSEAGGKIEGPAAAVLLPSGDLTDPKSWDILPISRKDICIDEFKESLAVGIYEPHTAEQRSILKKFGVLTALRALLDLRNSGNPEVAAFLDGVEGRKLHRKTVRYLRASCVGDVGFPFPADIYFMGFGHPFVLTGSDEDFPFAWSFIRHGEDQPCMVVMFCFWLIVWPLSPIRGTSTLNTVVFRDWVAAVMQNLKRPESR